MAGFQIPAIKVFDQERRRFPQPVSALASITNPHIRKLFLVFCVYSALPTNSPTMLASFVRPPPAEAISRPPTLLAHSPTKLSEQSGNHTLKRNQYLCKGRHQQDSFLEKSRQQG